MTMKQSAREQLRAAGYRLLEQRSVAGRGWRAASTRRPPRR